MENILPLIPACIHIVIFIFESFLWTHPKTQRAFRISESEANATKLFAFNQGFYNLFLALAVLLGIHLRSGEVTLAAGTALALYGLASMIGAGVVLFFSNRRLWRGALLQIVPAAIAFVPLLK